MNTVKKIHEKDVYDLYEQGYSQDEIAEKLGCHQSTVSAKLKICADTMVDWDKWSDAVIDMYIHDRSLEDIADMVGCSKWLIETYLNVNRYIVDERKIRIGIAGMPKAPRPKREVGELVVDHDTHTPYYDYTDLLITRWCEQKIPKWKLDLEEKGIVRFGYLKKGVKHEKN